MTQHFDFTLTQADLDLTTEFMIHLGDKEYFCSDDFRAFGLDANFADPQHDIGAYFARLKANGVAEPVGEVPSEIDSNNFRKVDLWRFNWSRWRSIVKSRLPEFAAEGRFCVDYKPKTVQNEKEEKKPC